MVSDPYRVLIAKPGLDSHDRGARALAAELVKEGFEVVYTGVAAEPGTVARAAVDEDVDAICLSMHVAAHRAIVKKVMLGLERLDGMDIPVVCGGIIPSHDVEELLAAGVREVVPPMVSLGEAVRLIRSHCETRRRSVITDSSRHQTS